MSAPDARLLAPAELHPVVSAASGPL